METDIPLRTLTAACAPDLLPLLGAPDAEVLATVLHRIQDPQRLRVLLGTVLRAPDLASVQQAVEAAATN